MSSVDTMADRVLEFIAAHAADETLAASEAAFDRLALDVFELQYTANPPYRAFCERRGRTPGAVAHWSEIPALPTSAFKAVDLACAPPERTFFTSGTTAGTAKRG